MRRLLPAALMLAACGPTTVIVAAPPSTAPPPFRDPAVLPDSPSTTTTATRPPVTHPSRGARPRTTASRPTVGDGCGGWRPLVSRYSWPVDEACRVLMCESRGDPQARNRRSSATGLFQVLGGSTNPEVNVAQAHAMFSRRGWAPWVCHA